MLSLSLNNNTIRLQRVDDQGLKIIVGHMTEVESVDTREKKNQNSPSEMEIFHKYFSLYMRLSYKY